MSHEFLSHTHIHKWRVINWQILPKAGIKEIILPNTIKKFYLARTEDSTFYFTKFTINHLYSHKPYTTVQRRHKYTYNKYRIDINIYTAYTTKTWVWDSLENKRFIYSMSHEFLSHTHIHKWRVINWQILPKAGIKEIILPNTDAKFLAVVQCSKIIFYFYGLAFWALFCRSYFY
jgi:hypothetical protein